MTRDFADTFITLIIPPYILWSTLLTHISIPEEKKKLPMIVKNAYNQELLLPRKIRNFKAVARYFSNSNSISVQIYINRIVTKLLIRCNKKLLVQFCSLETCQMYLKRDLCQHYTKNY